MTSSLQLLGADMDAYSCVTHRVFSRPKVPQTQKRKNFRFGGAPSETQSTKLTYFTTTERGTTTANSIKVPLQLAEEKLLVCGPDAWVNRKAGNHNFPRIKVTLSSELKASELRSSERSKTKPSAQLSQRGVGGWLSFLKKAEIALGS